MKYQEIPAQLVAIHTALVAKISAQPFIDPSLTCRQNGDWSISLYGPFSNGEYEKLARVSSDSPEECIEAAFTAIASLPDPDTAAKLAWHGNLGKVIDEGHALNLPDDVMSPLREVSQAMTENLLTAPAETA